MDNIPRIRYGERIYFLEIRKTNIDNYETLEIIRWDFKVVNKFDIIGYWELDNTYQFRMNGNEFLCVDSIAMDKFLRIGQKVLDGYLGEMRRMEVM